MIDDESPDGTAEEARKLKKENVGVIVRKGLRGRGRAGRAGYEIALRKGADLIIEMDADFSHSPQHIPELIEMASEYDIVLGSRLLASSKDEERPLGRRILTRAANWYVRAFLGLKIRDCNSGFRCFRRSALTAILPHLSANGPDIIQESIYWASKEGLRIKEIPIIFRGRAKGQSKLGMKQFMKGIATVLELRKRR